jgi:hypothetical protein
MATMTARITALLLLSSFGALLVPGCVIRIGPGSEDEKGAIPTPAEGDEEPPTAGGEELTPEEKEVIESLQHADPGLVKIGTATAVYAAVGTASLVESQIFDPNTVDEATLAQLYNEYAPLAIDQAMSWAQSIDPSTIPNAWNTINFKCEDEPYTCPRKDYCSFGGEPVLCVINECGTGSCEGCPWSLKNLIYKSWCIYGCGRGDQYLGSAFRLITRLPLKLGEFTCVGPGKL